MADENCNESTGDASRHFLTDVEQEQLEKLIFQTKALVRLMASVEKDDLLDRGLEDAGWLTDDLLESMYAILRPDMRPA